MDEKLEEMKKLIGQLPLAFQIFGVLVFVWMTWHTIPKILFVLQAFTVLAVLVAVFFCCFCDDEQTKKANQLIQGFRSLLKGEENAG